MWFMTRCNCIVIWCNFSVIGFNFTVTWCCNVRTLQGIEQRCVVALWFQRCNNLFGCLCWKSDDTVLVRERAICCFPRFMWISFWPRVITKFSFRRLWSDTNVVPFRAGTSSESCKSIVIDCPFFNIVCRWKIPMWVEWMMSLLAMWIEVLHALRLLMEQDQTHVSMV